MTCLCTLRKGGGAWLQHIFSLDARKSGGSAPRAGRFTPLKDSVSIVQEAADRWAYVGLEMYATGKYAL
jgi:hypothetical protein